jgi:ABC-type uncharacterized transport system auxiliary subunit
MQKATRGNPTAPLGAVVVVAAAILSGCSSGPPPRYFTLDLRPSGAARPSRCAIRVERLAPAAALSREEILVRTGPTEAEYYARDRWLEPPGDLVGEKLAGEFGPGGDGAPVVLVDGTLRAFEQVDAGGGAEGHVRLELTFRRPQAARSDEPLLRKTYEASVASDEPRPAAVARALSRAVEAAAAQIAADADRLAIK